jgi:hypothetical protein
LQNEEKYHIVMLRVYCVICIELSTKMVAVIDH